MLSEDALLELQVFHMGFYYQLLSQQLNTHQLGTREVYGCWSHGDVEFLHKVKKTYLRKENGDFVATSNLIDMVAYMFAGAENFYAASDASSLGVLAKLSVLKRACLGNVYTPQAPGDLCILDVDASSIPCYRRGVVVQGLQPARSSITRHSLVGDPIGGHLTPLDLVENTADFTSHIEPDWENDIQAILIAFRHQGRLVCRMAPVSIEQYIYGSE